MKINKDIGLDIFYSAFISFVILAKEYNVSTPDDIWIINIFVSMIVCAFLYIWIKALSRNFGVNIIKIYSTKEKRIFHNAVKLYSSFTSIKIVIFTLGFCIFCIIKGNIEFDIYKRGLLQIIGASFYVLSFYVIALVFFKEYRAGLYLAMGIFLPYILLFIVYGLFKLDSYLPFLIIPANINLLFFENSGNILEIFTFIISSFLLFILYYISILKLKRLYSEQLLRNN
jgi:hypothetical protein